MPRDAHRHVRAANQRGSARAGSARAGSARAGKVYPVRARAGSARVGFVWAAAHLARAPCVARGIDGAAQSRRRRAGRRADRVSHLDIAVALLDALASVCRSQALTAPARGRAARPHPRCERSKFRPLVCGCAASSRLRVWRRARAQRVGLLFAARKCQRAAQSPRRTRA